MHPMLGFIQLSFGSGYKTLRRMHKITFTPRDTDTTYNYYNYLVVGFNISVLFYGLTFMLRP